ncbi:nucleotidyltransferase family protein [Proteinivorax hydrogeniformans]|uniref:Nucleotidyltransferase family protein n=1 Tax=Proteinivorax hydrogeniformans TaxID=1826727 RepID=A0AAU8HTH5_9FIRM
MQKIRAVILAGDERQTQHMSDKSEKIQNKAFMKINGKFMLQYVLEVICSLEGIEEILVVGPKQPLEKLQASYDFKVVQQKGDIVDNVKACTRGWSGEKLLIVTSDIPMITRQSVRDFLKKASMHTADIYYPIIDKRSNEEMFPKVKRTYVKIKEGTFTGGNIALIDTDCVVKCEQIGKKLVAMRKSPIKLAKLLGFRFLAKLVANNLTIEELEQKLGSLLDSEVKAIRSSYPQLGTDIDKEEDLKIAETSLQKLKVGN